jgi:hypothetical protein
MLYVTYLTESGAQGCHQEGLLSLLIDVECSPLHLVRPQIKDTFRELLDAKRILRELRLLQHLGGHENLIWVLDIMVRDCFAAASSRELRYV